MINLSFSLSILSQILFSLTWLSYPYPRHSWFATISRNCLLLVLSPCCGCLLLVTLSLQYHYTSIFSDNLLLLIVKCFFSLYIQLLVIFFSFYLRLFDITLNILVVTVSSPCQHHFDYPCCNIIILVLNVFSFLRLLLFSLLQFSE